MLHGQQIGNKSSRLKENAGWEKENRLFFKVLLEREICAKILIISELLKCLVSGSKWLL